MTYFQSNTISLESVKTFCQRQWQAANQNTIDNSHIAIIYSVVLKLFSALFIYGFPGIGAYIGYPLFVASLVFDALLLLNIPAIVHKYFGYFFHKVDPRPVLHSVNNKIVQPVKEKTVEFIQEAKKSEIGIDFLDDMDCLRELFFGWLRPKHDHSQDQSTVKGKCL